MFNFTIVERLLNIVLGAFLAELIWIYIQGIQFTLESLVEMIIILFVLHAIDLVIWNYRCIKINQN